MLACLNLDLRTKTQSILSIAGWRSSLSKYIRRRGHAITIYAQSQKTFTTLVDNTPLAPFPGLTTTTPAIAPPENTISALNESPAESTLGLTLPKPIFNQTPTPLQIFLFRTASPIHRLPSGSTVPAPRSLTDEFSPVHRLGCRRHSQFHKGGHRHDTHQYRFLQVSTRVSRISTRVKVVIAAFPRDVVERLTCYAKNFGVVRNDPIRDKKTREIGVRGRVSRTLGIWGLWTCWVTSHPPHRRLDLSWTLEHMLLFSRLSISATV